MENRTSFAQWLAGANRQRRAAGLPPLRTQSSNMGPQAGPEEEEEAMTDDPRIVHYVARTFAFARREIWLGEVREARLQASMAPQDPALVVRDVIRLGGRLWRAPGGGLVRLTPEGQAFGREQQRLREEEDEGESEDEDEDDDDEDDGEEDARSTSSGASSRTAIYVGPASPTVADDAPRAPVEPASSDFSSTPRRPLPVVPDTSDDGLDNDDDESYVSLNDPSIASLVTRALHMLRNEMAAPNAPPNQALPYALGPPAMPTAGHHNDMQHIWSLVEELSGVLQQNRTRYNELQEGLSRVQTRAPVENGVLTNGDTNGTHAPANTAPAEDALTLSNQLAAAEARINELESAYREQEDINNSYEQNILDITRRVRDYCYDQQHATIALHAHYNSLLEQSRNETIQTQVTHQNWQASLSRLAENLRKAQRAHEEGYLPYQRKISALKEENRVLRQKAGWEPVSESEESESSSEDEEEDEDDEHDV